MRIFPKRPQRPVLPGPEAPLPELVLALHNTAWAPAEAEAWSRPPYVYPPRLVPIAERLLAVVPLLEEGVAGPLLAGSSEGNNVRITARWPRTGPRGAYGQVDAGEVTRGLIAHGVISVVDAEQIAALLDDDILARSVQRQLVLVHLAAGDLDAAQAAAERMGQSVRYGFRDIGMQLAKEGRAEEFFELWPRYEARTDRTRFSWLKEALVRGVAERSGWAAAIALCADKRLGPTLRWHAFTPLADRGEVAGLMEAFAGPAAEVLDEQRELGLMVRAVVAASAPKPDTDHPLLAPLLDRVISGDPGEDRDAQRDRDGLLLDLWPAYGDRATLDRARRAARTRRVRGELTVLAREL